MKIKIDLHPSWLKTAVHPAKAEKRLMERLKEIISGTHGKGPYKKDSGYDWQIDDSNNWWGQIEDGKLIVAYRYGTARLEALRPWLEVYFGE